MALTTLPQIGELRDTIYRLGRAQWRQLRQAILEGDEGTIADILIRAFMAAGIGGYDLVGQYIVDLPALSPEILLEMIDAANLFAGDAAVRALGAPYLMPSLREQYPEILVDEGLAQGYEFGAERAATAAEPPLQWKTWVRIYPVKEPRDWHASLEGLTLPEDIPFLLRGGPNVDALVDGPHDWDAVDDPSEWIGCGHSLVWTPAAEWGNVLKEFPHPLVS